MKSLLATIVFLFSGFILFGQNPGVTHIGTYSHNLPPGGLVEIVAPFDSSSQRLFANLEKDKVTIIDFSNPSFPDSIGSIDIAPFGTLALNVSVGNSLVAVAVQGVTKQDSGSVVFFDTNGSFINEITVGPAPGMLSFSSTGRYLLVANEGVPSSDYLNDPEGSVSIIDLINGPTNPATTHIGFSDYNIGGSLESSFPNGVHIYGPNATRSQDMEPEFLAIGDDEQKAYISLQENNAVMVIDIPLAQVDTIFALGYKDHNISGNELDASDNDGFINITNWPVNGMYQPDGIAFYSVNGNDYFLTANEGAARKYSGFSEEIRVADLSLNPANFNDVFLLQNEINLGRLLVTNSFGDIGEDGVVEELYSYGGRSFSIWDAATGSLVYDSGKEFEEKIALLQPAIFNSVGSSLTFDSKSDNKGPEPEDVVIGKLGNRTLAFIGIEQTGGFMVYDITDPTAPVFLIYETSAPGDLGPEASVFIGAQQSPTTKALLIVAHETSSTLAIYEIENTLGVSESNNNLLIYPNPTTSSVCILGNIPYFSYKLSSLTGQLLQSGTINAGGKVDLFGLESGIYILQINNTVYKIQKI